MELLLRYAAFGMTYWAFSLTAFGTPGDLSRLPWGVRCRAHAVAMAAMVAVWPVAAWSDLRSWTRTGP